MRKWIFISLIFVLLASGCMTSEQKYVSDSDKQRYITFSSDGTAFFHTGGLENYKGTYKEIDGGREKEINVFLDDGSSLVFRKISDDFIGLKVKIENDNGGIERFYKETSE